MTESGYEEPRTPAPASAVTASSHTLWYVDVRTGKAEKVSLSGLPGISTDPLAELRRKSRQDALKGERSVQVMSDFMGGGIRWSADGQQAAVMLRANDNKDRWIISVNAADGRVQNRHRLTDNAWINWGFNDFGWMADGRCGCCPRNRASRTCTPRPAPPSAGADQRQVGNLGAGAVGRWQGLLLPVQPAGAA